MKLLVTGISWNNYFKKKRQTSLLRRDFHWVFKCKTSNNYKKKNNKRAVADGKGKRPSLPFFSLPMVPCALYFALFSASLEHKEDSAEERQDDKIDP